MNRHVMTTGELAALVCTHESTIYARVRDGSFVLEPLRIGRKLLFRTADVESLLRLPAGSLSADKASLR
jgi:excisionase family DNA binding protein